jgi:antitoxin component YwqK of YwqJK toxin-antitoxin module
MIPRLALLSLLAAMAVACALPAGVPSDVPSACDHMIVEDHWPDGSLRERKQVLRLPDGTTVDDGPFERWYIDGTKEYEAVFIRGNKEGTTIRYHRNGRIASRAEYHDGKRNGPSVSWNDQGEKVKEELWADGRPHGTWKVWEDGGVAWTHTYVHGDPDP